MAELGPMHTGANHPQIPQPSLLSLVYNNSDVEPAVTLGDLTVQLSCWEGYCLRDGWQETHGVWLPR